MINYDLVGDEEEQVATGEVETGNSEEEIISLIDNLSCSVFKLIIIQLQPLFPLKN